MTSANAMSGHPIRDSVVVRLERREDVKTIRCVNVEAFRNHPFSRQTEHLIVDALRAAGALEISLVAELDASVIGHIAFSKAQIGQMTMGWYLLGPVAVRPALQRRGIGRALIEAGLDALRSREASGCALVGDPAFYQRFGFQHVPGITCAGVPDRYVLCLSLAGPLPSGDVVHHPAFAIGPESTPGGAHGAAAKID